ncbi:MAG: hypothetical protein DWI29_02925 [Planctomycetota bacterium]|nr:MAG: hypothetical protein DWI29_02925 [Planctomycetota bacterium]
MDRTTLRGIAFWTTVVAHLMPLMISAIYAPASFSPFGISGEAFFRVKSMFSLFVSVVSVGSLLVYLGLVHYDLMTAQRLSEHARDYLIRDLTQSSEENKSHHG